MSNTAKIGRFAGRRRRNVLLCTALFIGGVLLVTAIADIGSAYAGDTILLESLRDGKWPVTGDC